MPTSSTRSPGGGGGRTSTTGGPFVRRLFHVEQAGQAVARRSTWNSTTGSDVQEPHISGVALDEGAAGLDVLAHERGEELVGAGRVVQGHLQQHALGRVHRGAPQL